MKKLTIKLKITLWFTIFMIILSAGVFAFIAMLSNSATMQQTRGILTDLVNDNTRKIEYERSGRLKIDDKFVSFKNGVYCLIFYEDGEKISGYAPYSEMEDEPLGDDSIRPIEVGGETYLIYDKLIQFKKHEDVWIRGIVLKSGNPITSSAVYQSALIALPLLILLAAVGGYILAGRSLRPIQKISQTAEDIGNGGDLSTRIELTRSGKDELYQLAETFNQMFERLETNFKAEASFTSDASHELRTPVAIILAQCEYAFENASGEQELYEVLGAIQKQGYRMSHLIESLLQFTRIEQRTEKASFEMIEFSKLVSSVCDEQEKLGEKGIRLSTQIQPNIIINADRTLICQMLQNLIRNAYRYGKENGNITISLKENNANIILSVTDDGIGIAPDDLPKIWNRFFRVDKSRSTVKGTGLGLGLAMVKQIVEIHSGKVGVDSEPDRGSVFTVEFPIRK